MIRSLYSGATGMYAQQLEIDNISNNLANVNTNGFKKSMIHFQDLIYQTLQEAGSPTSASTSKPNELSVGVGVKPVSTQKIFTQGGLENTGNPLDLSIEGEGFFMITKADGEMSYSRDGSLRINDEGRIVTADGFYLEPGITIPSDTESISISPDGIIMAKPFGSIDSNQIGQIQLSRFINPAGLKSVGGNRYLPTTASGEAMTGTPGTGEFGEIHQGYVETSNVAIVEEMVNMIIAQRAYELNSKTVKTAESMIELAVNLKR